MTRLARTAIALPVLWLAGCLNSSHSALDQSSFAVICSDGDASCSDPGAQVALPGVVAVESSLQVAFTGEQATQSTIAVRPASPVMALPEGLSIRFTSKGYCALLARSEAGTVVDLVHVRVLPVSELAIAGPAALAPGEAGELTVEPHGPQGEVLGGSLVYSWSSSDPSVAAVNTSAQGNRAKVLGVGPGVATIKVMAGGSESSLALTVSEAP